MRSFPAPAPGDLAWCRFPEAEGIRPSPKARPALILAVQDDVSPVRVRVAYGTSQDTGELAPWEFRIGSEDGVAFTASGLALATKFSMRKVVVLDYTDLWFCCAPGRPVRDTPRLGVLHPAILPRARSAFEATLSSLSVRERLNAVYGVQASDLDEFVLEIAVKGRPRRTDLDNVAEVLAEIEGDSHG